MTDRVEYCIAKHGNILQLGIKWIYFTRLFFPIARRRDARIAWLYKYFYNVAIGQNRLWKSSIYTQLEYTYVISIGVVVTT